MASSRKGKGANGGELQRLEAEVASLRKAVGHQPRPQLRHYDTEAASSLTLAPIRSALFNPVSGTGELGLANDRAQLKDLEFTLGLTRGNTSGFVRLLLIQWVPINTSDPGVGDVIDTSYSAGSEWKTAINFDTMAAKQMHLLVDKTFEVTAGSDAVQFKWRGGLPVRDVTWATQGSVATNTAHSGEVYAFLMTNISSGLPSYSFYSRIRYTSA